MSISQLSQLCNGKEHTAFAADVVAVMGEVEVCHKF